MFLKETFSDPNPIGSEYRQLQYFKQILFHPKFRYRFIDLSLRTRCKPCYSRRSHCGRWFYLFRQLLSLAAPFSATTTQSTPCAKFCLLGEACVASKLWRSPGHLAFWPLHVCSRGGAALKCGSLGSGDNDLVDNGVVPIQNRKLDNCEQFQ